MLRADLHLPAGTASEGDDPVVVTPDSAGWELCGLRVVRLAAGEPRELETGPDEVAVLPLSGGGVVVEIEGRRLELVGRRSVFDRSRVGGCSLTDLSAPLAESREGEVEATSPLRQPVSVALTRFW